MKLKDTGGYQVYHNGKPVGGEFDSILTAFAHMQSTNDRLPFDKRMTGLVLLLMWRCADSKQPDVCCGVMTDDANGRVYHYLTHHGIMPQ